MDGLGMAATQDTPAPSLSSQHMSRLLHLLDEQVAILRRIDERQSTADLSQQPIPDVPASNSSAWNALLNSALTNTIQPRVEIWRSGLDALLVFLGLFSAIISAFLVNSIASISPDKTDRTNELLANLTDIVLTIHNYSATSFKSPAQFHPDPVNVRVNAFWALSLTISLAIAALAVGCRGFINMITWSRHKKASQRLTDIWARWNAANRVLRPAIELLPQALILPVFLFLVGVLDILFSSVRALRPLPPFLLLALVISVLCVTGVAALLAFTVVDGSIHPESSPFRSNLSYAIHTLVLPRLRRARRVLLICLRRKRGARRAPGVNPFTPSPRLDTETGDLYHEMVQRTHEDENLDQAAGALFSIVHDDATTAQRIRISPQVCNTLLHLLSPEASIRCNRTAASVIIRIQAVDPRKIIVYPRTHVEDLLTALISAAKRSPGGYNLATLWDSWFIRAISVMLLEEDKDPTEHPLILRCLSSRQMIWSQSLFASPSFTRKHHVYTFLLDVLYAKMHAILPILPGKADARAIDLLLSPQFTLAAVPVTISTSRLMRSLVYHLPWDRRHEQIHIVRWIMKVTSPSHAISLYLRSFQELSAADIKSLSWALCSNMFTIVDIVSRVCLESDFGYSSELEAVAELCATCLAKFILFRDRLQALTFPFDLVQTFRHVLRNFTLSHDSDTYQKLTIIVEFVRRVPDARYADFLEEFRDVAVGDWVEDEGRSSWESDNLSWLVNSAPSDIETQASEDTR